MQKRIKKSGLDGSTRGVDSSLGAPFHPIVKNNVKHSVVPTIQRPYIGSSPTVKNTHQSTSQLVFEQYQYAHSSFYIEMDG